MDLYGKYYEQQKRIAEDNGIEWDKYKRLVNRRLVGKFCLHCKNRVHASRHQSCLMRPSSRSENGYKTVRAHDDACGLYDERRFR